MAAKAKLLRSVFLADPFESLANAWAVLFSAVPVLRLRSETNTEIFDHNAEHNGVPQASAHIHFARKVGLGPVSVLVPVLDVRMPVISGVHVLLRRSFEGSSVSSF